MKALRTVLSFLSFKRLTYAYLMKTFITHNKYLTFQFLEKWSMILDPISARSSAQILSLNPA